MINSILQVFLIFSGNTKTKALVIGRAISKQETIAIKGGNDNTDNGAAPPPEGDGVDIIDF